MKINQHTRLFEYLTEEESKEMLIWAENILLHGNVAHPIPKWVNEWLDLFEEKETFHYRLYLQFRELSVKALLSVTNYYKETHLAHKFYNEYYLQ